MQSTPSTLQPPPPDMVLCGNGTTWQSRKLAIKTESIHHTTQCVHPITRETGCWLFIGSDHRIPHTAVSPVFRNLMALFRYAKDAGIEITFTPANRR